MTWTGDEPMTPIEAWADACEGAIRAVEMVSFEEQGRTAIEQAWKLVWLARKLAGIELGPEQFTADQIEFLRHVGVRVKPHTNSDGTPNQAVFNDRADKAEAQLAKLRENLKLIAAIDATLEDHGCDSFVPRQVHLSAEQRRLGAVEAVRWHPREKTCYGTGWYRCPECVLYSGQREEES